MLHADERNLEVIMTSSKSSNVERDYEKKNVFSIGKRKSRRCTYANDKGDKEFFGKTFSLGGKQIRGRRNMLH